MSEGQQLERSVLEAKERDELHAIAEALGLKPSARAAKATLVGLILRATGVEQEGDAPPRTRSSRGRAAAAAAGARSGAPASGNGDNQAPQPAGEAGEAVDAVDGVDGGAPPRHEPDRGPDPGLAGTGAPAQAGPVRADDGRDDGRPLDAGPAPADAEAPAPPGGGRPGLDGGNGRDPSDPGFGGQQGGPGHGRPAEAPRDRGNGSGQPGQNQQGQHGQGPAGAAHDPNRRSRRRRGRDRNDKVGERDLPGPAPEQQPFSGDPVPVAGLLDLNDQGYGFLRTSGYLAGARDVYVSISQVRRFALRKGDHVEGASRPAGSSEKYPALVRIDTVSGLTPDEARARPRFEELTPLFPDEKLRLEVPGQPGNMVARIVDLISPIGKGQRGLIVSPPKAGKTTILKQIAHSIEANNPEVHLMVLLVDERPEEVTDMRRSVQGEVVASTFDRPSEEHTAVAELALDRARRLVELGRDVVIVLDGITRLARAYNLAQPASGRILSGGVDANALYPPKRFFGSARNIEEGGSLTILATALVETGSRMDEVIFEEFKGTGNMELRLDRRMAERRIYPAIDVNGSSTRHEELLFDRTQLQQVWKLRRVLQALGAEGSGAAGLELLMDKIKATKSNDEFLAEIAKGPTVPV